MQFRENIHVMFHLSPVIQKELVIKMSRCFKETDNKLCDLNVLKQDWKAQTETIQCANKKPVTNKLVASELWEMPVNFPQEDKKISYWSFWPSVSNFLAGWRRKPCSAPVSGKPPRSSAHGSDEETWWPPDRVSDWIWRCLAVYKVTSTEIYFRKGDSAACQRCHVFSPSAFPGGNITSPWWNGQPTPNWLSTGWTEPRTTPSWHCVRRPLESALRWNKVWN